MYEIMMKIIDYRISILLFVLVYCTIPFSGTNATEGDNHLVRQKRNLLCSLKINEFLEKVLQKTLDDLHVSDPMKLGDSKSNKLEDGVLKGLSSLTNVTDLKIDCDKDSVTFSTTLALKNAEVKFKYQKKVVIKAVKLHGTVSSSVKEVNFDFQVRLNYTQTIRVDVDRMVVSKLDGLKFGITGLGPFNPLVKGFANIMEKIWATKIAKVMQKVLKQTLEKQFSKLTIPSPF